MINAELKPLNSIAEIVRGVTFARNDASQFPIEEFLPVLRAGNIQAELLLNEDLLFVPERIISAKQRLRADDIVMCTSSGSSSIVGKSAFLESDWNGSFGAFCVAVRANKEVCLPRYLFHYLQTSAFRYWTRKSSGINIKNIRKSELDNVIIPLPVREKQYRIATILDKADAIRRKRKQFLIQADELLKSVFLKIFGNPVSNPYGWSRGTIRDLVREVKYGTSQRASTDTGQYKILRMGNITYSGQLDIADLKYVDIEPNSVEKYTVRKGDILFNRTNSKELVGKTTVFDLDEAFAYAGYLVRARVNECADPYYISGFLNSDYGKFTLRSMCKSIIGMANINAQDFQNISILIPPVNLQRKYRDLHEVVRNQSKKWQKALEEANTLAASFSQRAFRGEL